MTKIHHKFKVGDHIRYLAAYTPELDTGEIYIVKEFRVGAGDENHTIYLEGFTGSWYTWAFELVIFLQDNEFVETMRSDKRMLEI